MLAIVGLPTFGMALAITAVSTYLPVVASQFTSSATVIGLIIGGEGMMALWLPVISGTWSDRLTTPIGKRIPFILAGTPMMVVGLVLVGLVGALAGLALAVGIFFAGYFVAYEPYRALYPDIFGDAVAGRAQGNQAVWRGVGTGVALLAGGALLSVANFLPFACAALVLVAANGAFTILLLRYGDPPRGERSLDAPGVRRIARRVRELLTQRPALRHYLIANSLWELAMGALKTFIVLYVTAGLGFSLAQASLIIGGVAVIVLLGGFASGKLADRLGRLRVLRTGLWVYGAAMLVPMSTGFPPVLIPAVPVVAFGGGMIMGLPYAVLMPLMPEGEHGVITGIYSLSRGLGTMLGPILGGVAIQTLGPVLFSSTNGYAAMWVVTAAAIFASLPFLAKLRSDLHGEPDHAAADGRAGSGSSAA
jgi:MFS family permease